MAKKSAMTPTSAALYGVLLSLPLVLLWSAVVLGIGALEIFLKALLTIDGNQPSAFGKMYMIGSLLLLPIALIVTIFPMLKQRKFFVLNLLVALGILVLMRYTWWELGIEVYRCDILHITNCD